MNKYHTTYLAVMLEVISWIFCSDFFSSSVSWELLLSLLVLLAKLAIFGIVRAPPYALTPVAVVVVDVVVLDGVVAATAVVFGGMV